MCSTLLQVFLTIILTVSSVLCSNYPMIEYAPAFIKVREDRPIGFIIGNVTATDDDGPQPLYFYIPPQSLAAKFVSIENKRGTNADGMTVDLVIIQQFDRDKSTPDSNIFKMLEGGIVVSERQLRFDGYSQLDLVLFVEDNYGQTPKGNTIQQQITIYITDVNDVKPEFKGTTFQAKINESAAVDSEVIKIEADDPDTGLGGLITFNMTPSVLAVSDDYSNSFRIESDTGRVIVNNPLDYDDLYNYYEFTIMATDGGGLTADPAAKLTINVVDVQDKPPYFTNIPYQANILENITSNTPVLQVSALDGDRQLGVSNQVTYSWIGGDHSNFELNAQTGWISVVSSLDRDTEDMEKKSGVYTMVVKAREVDASQPENMITATATVTIIVDDVNDNAPEFNNPNTPYQATIQENSEEKVSITFTSPVKTMTVKDNDQGENSHSEILLEKDGQPYDDFEPSPSELYADSNNIVQIRVKNKAALDYEKVQSVTFQVIAREKNTAERRSSVVTVTVQILDVNDNSPEFEVPVYPVQNVSENALFGTPILTLRATDADIGRYGQIEYSLPGNTKFAVNKTTGEVTVAGALDREKVDSYDITAEARDSGGYNVFTTLHIKILDENDNAPVFRRDEYFATVKEDSLDFLRAPITVEARDDDEPGTVNSQVKYRILQASDGLQNKFQVDPDSGEITLSDKIDYEALDPALAGKVLLEIEAYDLGTPTLRSKINVTVEVEDVNDNPPYFNATEYLTSIPENATEGSSVLFVFATDNDQTKRNNEFLYRIDSGAGDKFRIDFQTGEITVERGAQLDREDKDYYVLDVSATDRGAVSLDGFCKVKITITDINDESPVFSPVSVSATVAEELLSNNQGKNIVTVTAADADEDHDLVYSLITESIKANDEDGDKINATEVQGWFGVQGSSGIVYVKAQLDREKAETVILEVLATDLNAATDKEQTATGTVTVTIEDVNDNPPRFKQDQYSIPVSEGLDANSEVLRLEAVDIDKKQTVTYEMDNDPSQNFTIESLTGILRLRQKLDRENEANLTVTVIAKDNVAPQQTSTATIFVEVLDINDNNPVFDTYLSSYNIAENSDLDTSIARITATDRDDKNFGKIVYSFNVQNDDNALKINRTTGVISVARPIDREMRSSYTLYVTATDNPDSSPDNQRANQTTAITINIDDINDEDPVFTNIDPQIKHSVLENADKGHLVFTVTAEDNDIGNNARLDYTLSADDSSVLDLFVINTVTKNIGGVPKYFGEIKVNENLLGKVEEYTMDVTATDRGVPPRSVMASLIIKVEDVNLHQPVFVNPPGPRNTIQTDEEQEPGSIIMTITASDEDHGRNADVFYTLLEENDWEQFLINGVTGDLSFKNKLDRETKSSYEIKIQAEDNGIPNKLDSTLTLIIVLLDINDKLPEFSRDAEYPDQTPPYRIMIQEEKVANDTTVDLNIAVDEDKDNNSVICYYIIGGDDVVRTHFQLDQRGNLTLTTAFDRENLTNPVINMIIWATPRCFEQIDMNIRPNIYPPTDYGRNRTLLWVEVVITDINDNPPEFKQPVLTLGVTRSTGYGTAILNLMTLVTDKDATMKVEFIVYGTETHLQNNKQVADPFIVFKNGTVKTNTYFQADMYGYFLIYVGAEEKISDGLIFSANATLRISLINDDQRVKVVFQQRLDTVRGFQVQFTTSLQSTIGYRIVLDKIQTHENSQGLPEVNKTDMFIHGEDFKTNETLSAAELLRLIDSYADALFNLRYNYKVLEIVPTVVAVDEEDLENVFRMALILVTILLCLLCIAICIVFYLSRQKYIRKLKAATAMAYEASRYSSPPSNGLQNPYHAPVSVSSDNESPPPLTALEGKVWRQTYDRDLNSGKGYSDLQKIDTPGTNLHAYENTNPIYLEKIKLEESNDDLDNDSIDDNAVDQSKPGQYSEHQATMNFYTEDNNLNRIPQSKIGSGDAILTQAIKQHEATKVKNGSLRNGSVDHRTDNFDGLPTTEI